MESAESPLRLRLILGKFRVTNIEKGVLGFKATLDLGVGVKMVIDCPPQADLRLGDLCTYYTECPYAQHSTTPKQ